MAGDSPGAPGPEQEIYPARCDAGFAIPHCSGRPEFPLGAASLSLLDRKCKRLPGPEIILSAPLVESHPAPGTALFGKRPWPPSMAREIPGICPGQPRTERAPRRVQENFRPRLREGSLIGTSGGHGGIPIRFMLSSPSAITHFFPKLYPTGKFQIAPIAEYTVGISHLIRK